MSRVTKLPCSAICTLVWWGTLPYPTNEEASSFQHFLILPSHPLSFGLTCLFPYMYFIVPVIMDFFVLVIMCFLYYPVSVQIILGCWAVTCPTLVAVCMLPLQFKAPAGLSWWLEDLFICLVWAGHRVPPKHSFSRPFFSRAAHFNLQLTIGDYFSHFPETAEATCVCSAPTLSPRISP